MPWRSLEGWRATVHGIAKKLLSMHAAEAESETQTTDLCLPRGRGLGARMSWESGASRCRLVYTECVKKILLYTQRTTFNIL